MEKNNKKFIVIAGLILLAIATAAVSFYIKNQPSEENIASKKTSDVVLPKKQEVPTEGNFWTGAADSKVTIVEFADFKCPYCKKSYDTLRRIETAYKNSVKIVFKDYPLHDGSIELAVAARCAGEQDLFWEMHDKIFLNQDSKDPLNINKLALSIGADEKTFTTCLNDEKINSKISSDIQDGQKLNISGTPTFFVNGYRVAGDLPFESWQKIINLLLE